MIIRISKTALCEKLFCTILFIYNLSYWVLKSSEFRHLINGSEMNLWIIRFSTVLLAAIPFLKQKITSKKAIAFTVAILLFALIYLKLKYMTMLLFVMLLIGATYIDSEKIVRVDFLAKTTILLMVCGLCLIGILPNYTAVINDNYKMALGFEHPNTLSFLGCAIIVEYLYLHYERLRKFDALFVACMFLFLYKTAASRTTLFTVLAVIFVLIVLKAFPKLFVRTPVKQLFIAMPALMAGFSLVSVYQFAKGNRLMIALNEVVTGRLHMGDVFLRKYGVTLFGQEIEIIGSREAEMTNVPARILDNAYMRALINYGLVFFLFIVIGYCVFFYRCVKRKNTKMAILALFFILIGFGETHTILVTSNVTLMFLLSPYRTENMKLRIKTVSFIQQLQLFGRSYFGAK